MSITRARRSLAPILALDANLQHRRLLYIFTYLASVTALLILHLALDDLRLTQSLIGTLTAGFVYSYYVTPRFRAVTTYAVSFLAAGLAIYYYLKIQADFTLYGNYLGLLLGILTALLAYKAFSPADHRFILMVCVIFLLFSSVASYDLKFMLLLPLFLIFSGIALYIANQIEVAIRVAGTTGKSRAPRVYFDVGWSFMWVLLRAIIGLILLSVVAYIITPHSSQSQRKLILTKAPSVQDPSENPDFQDPESASSIPNDEVEIGIGENFDLTDTRRLSADPRPVLEMKSHRRGYLRAQVYDVYTGSGWIKSPRLDPELRDPSGELGLELFKLTKQEPEASHEMHTGIFDMYPVRLFDFPSETMAEDLKNKHNIIIKDAPENIYSVDSGQELDYDIVRQEIKLLEEQPPFYFSLYQPFRLENVSQSDSRGTYDEPWVDSASTIRPASLDRPHPEKFSYTVYSLEPRPKASQLQSALGYGPPGITSLYTQLPLEPEFDQAVHAKWGISKSDYRPIRQNLLNFAGQFAQRPLPEGGIDSNLSTYEKVMAIYNHLLSEENGYTYSRDFQNIDGDTEICEAFLLGTRAGYCRYFASAMAVLCRINGIPARIVTGYSPGAFSLIDNAYIYKASNAHAWVEVYFDGYGWIMFDPSPTSNIPYSGSEAQQWIGGVIDFLQNLFIIDPASTQQLIISALASLWETIRAHGLASLLTAAVAVALLLLIWLLLRLRGRRRASRLVPENSVVETYLVIARQLERLGLKQAPGQTARAFLHSAGDAHSELSGPCRRLAPVYERAAYSVDVPRETDLELAAESLKRVNTYVREELQRRRQQQK